MVNINYDYFTDPRDGEKYRIAHLNDGNIWFADNLRYKAPDCRARDGSSGFYYSGTTIKEVSPFGWKIPDPNDWRKLFKIYSESISDLNEAGLDIRYEGEMRNGEFCCPDEACYWTTSHPGLFKKNKESLQRVKFIGSREFYVFSEHVRHFAQTRCFRKA